LYRAEQVFGLKYFLSSQSAILWMCVCFALACVFYWLSLLSKNQAQSMGQIASKLTWVAVLLAITGSLVRWFESYLIGSDVGHIPVSNLYEVFVLFCWFTALFYLYFEERYAVADGHRYSLGAFVLLIICAAVGFLLWYSFARDAQQIQPLVPALQSWWMKLHVPANFIGYGTFSLAAMVAFAYLIKAKADENNWLKLAPLFGLGIVLCLEPLVFRKNPIEAISSYWAVYFGATALITGGIIAARRRIAANLPDLAVLDGVMYKAITIGFAFFTIATILGAFWAAEAWGGYWSWDPKETWALIVWLNYAAWLHLRLMKGMRGSVAAWWALIGLVITTFAFLGVNMFLSGLHSYGTL
jgi:cytochrome c-type biogenesis protein CcsB